MLMPLNQGWCTLTRMNCGRRGRTPALIWGLWQLTRSATLLAWATLSTMVHWWDPYTVDTAPTSSCIQMIFKGSRLCTVNNTGIFWHGRLFCLRHYLCCSCSFSGKPENSPPPRNPDPGVTKGVATDPCKASLDAVMLGTETLIPSDSNKHASFDILI